MKIIYFCLMMFGSIAFADVYKELSQLNNQIKTINKNISSKKQKQLSIQKALKNSEQAITYTDNILKKMSTKHNEVINQLQQIKQMKTEVTTNIALSYTNSNKILKETYKNLISIENDNHSILGGNSFAAKKTDKIYLTKILKQQITALQTLQTKLKSLQESINGLERQLKNYDIEVKSSNIKKEQIRSNKAKQLQLSRNIADEIKNDNNNLSNLKNQSARLNSLIAKLQVVKKPKVIVKEDNTTSKQNNFTSKQSQPINSKRILAFGELHNKIKSRGELYKVDDSQKIYAFSNGKVLYSNSLPGFGQIIVIEHNDNYMSIYSGTIPQVKKSQVVTAGETIGMVNTKSTKQLGGFYFELRHLGQPVKPSYN